MISSYMGDWRLIALRGVAAILFGLGALIWPDVTLWALVLMWGAFALVDGVGAVTAAIAGGGVVRHRGWLAFRGLVGIAAGVVTFIWPSITALALLYVIAAWAFLSGVVEIATAVSMRKQIANEWALGLAGVLSLVLSVLLVITPGSGALAITWLIGWYAVVYGGTLLALAREVRREGRRPEVPGTSAHPGAPHPAA